MNPEELNIRKKFKEIPNIKSLVLKRERFASNWDRQTIGRNKKKKWMVKFLKIDSKIAKLFNKYINER